LGVPQGIVIDGGGTLYYADSEGKVIRRVSPDGLVTTIAGRPGSGGAADGPAGNARFSSPSGITLDQAGNLIVADPGNCAVRRVTPPGSVDTIVGRPRLLRQRDGAAAAVRVGHAASGVAIDTCWQSSSRTPTIQSIRRAAPDGTVSTLATGSGNAVDRRSQRQCMREQSLGPEEDFAGRRRDDGCGNENVFGTTDGPGGVALFQSMQAVHGA
jgi:hypothetical protein